MEPDIDARLARIEAYTEFAAAAGAAIAGSLKARNILGDGAWNDLFAKAEDVSHRSADLWPVGRALREALGTACS